MSDCFRSLPAGRSFFATGEVGFAQRGSTPAECVSAGTAEHESMAFSTHLPTSAVSGGGYSSFIFKSCSMCSRELHSLGTLFCPPSLPRDLSQSLNRPRRAFIISSGWSVMFLKRFAS